MKERPTNKMNKAFEALLQTHRRAIIEAFAIPEILIEKDRITMKLTRKMIYVTIAEAFHRPWSGRTIEERRYTLHGICKAYAIVAGELRPSGLFDSMDNIFWPLLMPTRRWTDSWKREYDMIRGDLATLLSLISDEDYERLLLRDE